MQNMDTIFNSHRRPKWYWKHFVWSSFEKNIIDLHSYFNIIFLLFKKMGCLTDFSFIVLFVLVWKFSTRPKELLSQTYLWFSNIIIFFKNHLLCNNWSSQPYYKIRTPTQMRNDLWLTDFTCQFKLMGKMIETIIIKRT